MMSFDFVTASLRYLSTMFVFAIGSLVVLAVVLFFVDILQTKDAVRRNYPLIGRFRYLFSILGEFFRQYFFAMDREELPFNRAERDWIRRASANKKTTIAFGSSKNLNQQGTLIFVNCAFPKLKGTHLGAKPLRIGPHARQPYDPPSIINISAMSYGALSRPAVKALSKGAKLANCWMNTGEGGLSKYHLKGECDIVFQIGTAKYGVRTIDGKLCDTKLREVAANPQVKMFELKLSQGAKPGKGGILPAAKVSKEIATIRGIPEGKPSISPNRHPEVDSPSQLLTMINHIREVTGKPVGFKSVIGASGWLEELCELIVKRGEECAPDFITIDGGDGGTGAAPMPLMDNVGLTLRESLPMVANILQKHKLRDRIRINASGKLIAPSEVAWALCAGANFISTARGFMFALGCIQSLKCNKNTCPTGITTHNPRFQRGLVPHRKNLRVAAYHKQLTREVEIIAHSCGVDHPGRLDRMHVRIVQNTGRSLPMNEIYPWPEVTSH